MKAIAVIAACSAICAGGAAQAKDWIVSLGGRVDLAPPYEGSDQRGVYFYPTFAIRSADRPERFVAPDDGARLTIYRNDWLAVGPMVKFRGKRDSDGEFQGLREIKWAAEPGAFVDFWPTSWLRLHVQGGRGVRGHHGWVADSSADFVYDRGHWIAAIGPRIGVGDERYMERYFGVTATEAAASPVIHTTYDPSGGVRYLGAGASVAYRLGDQWKVRVSGSFHRLSSEAANSPIVEVLGARDQFSAGVGLGYSFNASF